ncbi:MAG: hypothetical protein SGJ21_08475, partial [Alphaproteobacteria bacterium]|nr:hypothetical protein [Alphaproteobacteria bacterium]
AAPIIERGFLGFEPGRFLRELAGTRIEAGEEVAMAGMGAELDLFLPGFLPEGGKRDGTVGILLAHRPAQTRAVELAAQLLETLGKKVGHSRMMHQPRERPLRPPAWSGSVLCRLGLPFPLVARTAAMMGGNRGEPVSTKSEKPTRKSQIDTVLLKIPGASTKKIGGLDAYFVNDRMFACISGDGVGLRLPAATARDLQFSRENVAAFNPGGVGTTKEWVQINRAEAADYEKDLELFQAALDFVKGNR